MSMVQSQRPEEQGSLWAEGAAQSAGQPRGAEMVQGVGAAQETGTTQGAGAAQGLFREQDHTFQSPDPLVAFQMSCPEACLNL